MRIGILLLFLCSFYINGFGQIIEASTSAKDVYVNQGFDIVYTIQNADKVNFNPPDFSPLEIIGGPFTSNSISIMNGQRSSSSSYTYRVTADKAGKYTIPAASIRLKGQTYRSNTITINVIDRKDGGIAEMDDIYMEMVLRDSTVYVGQQLIIDHFLYFGDKKVASASLISEFPRDRFLINRVSDASNIRTQQVRHNGKIVREAHISRLALYPLRSGDIDIPRTVFSINIQKEDYSRRGFFSFFEREEKVLSAPAQELNVLPLPSGEPNNFTNIVGDLQLTVKAPSKNVSQGEEIIVSVVVQGNGIGEQLVLPEWTDANFEIYEPKMINERVIVLDGEINFIKEYDVLVVPKTTGKIGFGLEYSYFDSQTDQYIETASNRISLQVEEGSGPKSDASTKTLEGQRNQNANKRKYLYTGLGALALVGAFLFVFFTKKKEPESQLTEEEIKVKAMEIAIKKLSSAKALLDNQQTGQYWETLEKSIQMYVQEKLNLPTTHFNRENVIEKWSELNLSETTLETWKGFNDKINRARYAGQSISQMETLYQEALDWIQNVEAESLQQ